MRARWLEPGGDRDDRGSYEDQHPTECSHAERAPAELLDELADSCYLRDQPRLDVRQCRPALSMLSVDPLPHLVEFLADSGELATVTLESLFNRRALGRNEPSTERATGSG